MKRFKKYIQLFASLAVLGMAGSCADDTFDSIKGFSQDKDITLTLRMPGFATRDTRAITNECYLHDIQVIYVGDYGTLESENTTEIDGNDNSNTGNTRTVNLTLPAGTTTVKIIGNYGANGLSTATADVVETSAVDPNSATCFLFYGEQSVSNLENNATLSIDLYRTSAKTTIDVAEGVADCEIIGAWFYGTPDKCKVQAIAGDDPALPNGVDYSTTPVAYSSTDIAKLKKVENSACGHYHYAAEKDNCYWVLELKDRGFYRVDYIELDETDADSPKPKEDALDIIRNHHYQFTITNVNHDGYATQEEAAKAGPDNKLEVELFDHEEKIYDMVACKDYYLGVDSEVEVDADAEVAIVEMVENYTAKPNCELKDGWLTIVDNYSELINYNSSKKDWFSYETSSPNEGTSKNALLYNISIPVKENLSSEPREAILEIKVGDLSRTVKIIQKGKDYFDGALTIAISEETFGAPAFEPDLANRLPNILRPYKDYLTFLKKTLKGASKDAMGVDRNKGIHFPVYAETQPIYYLVVDNIADELVITEGGDYFEIERVTSTTPNYYKISIKPAGNKNYEIWTGKMKLTKNSESISIGVYHTGVIHELKSQYQLADPDGNILTGWFYYEQVDTEGIAGGMDGKLYHMLDRNLGASSNKPYSPSGLTTNGNTDSRGAYFYIPEDKNKKDKMYEALEAIMPKGFNDMIMAYHLTDMGIRQFSQSDGSYGINTVAPSKLSKVYYPVSGNMTGDMQADNGHVNLWCSSILSGNQGFDPSSPEYGYWYRYLDIFGTTEKVRNTRIFNRTDLSKSGMPIRCMVAPKPMPGWDGATIPNGRCRVILMNPAGWDVASANFYDPKQSDGNRDVVGMTLDESGDFFIITLNCRPSSIYFTGKTVGGSGKTKEFSVANGDYSYPTDENTPAIIILSNEGANSIYEEEYVYAIKGNFGEEGTRWEPGAFEMQQDPTNRYLWTTTINVTNINNDWEDANYIKEEDLGKNKGEFVIQRKKKNENWSYDNLGRANDWAKATTKPFRITSSNLGAKFKIDPNQRQDNWNWRFRETGTYKVELNPDEQWIIVTKVGGGGGGNTSYNIVYTNPCGWSEVYVYYTLTNGSKPHSWPGVAMTKSGNNWISTVPNNTEMIIFNNNNKGHQTDDIYDIGSKTYTDICKNNNGETNCGGGNTSEKIGIWWEKSLDVDVVCFCTSDWAPFWPQAGSWNRQKATLYGDNYYLIILTEENGGLAAYQTLTTTDGCKISWKGSDNDYQPTWNGHNYEEKPGDDPFASLGLTKTIKIWK